MCTVASCPDLTVLNSGSTGVTGSTFDTRVVNCDNGYTSSSGVTFTASCDGTAPGVSAWSNTLTCDGTVEDC